MLTQETVVCYFLGFSIVKEPPGTENRACRDTGLWQDTAHWGAQGAACTAGEGSGGSQSERGMQEPDDRVVSGGLCGKHDIITIILKGIVMSTLWKAETKGKHLQLLHVPAAGLN